MKRTIKSMLMVAVVVTGGWVSAQQDESSAVAATPEETNALNQKLKEAMARRADEAKKAASELRATSEAVKPAASTNNASRLPTRTVQVGGGSTMNLGKLIQNANASGATGAETPTPTPIGSSPTSAPGNQVVPAQNPQAGANVPNAFGQISSPNGGPVNASGEELYEMVPNGDAFELVEVLNRYEMISGRQQLRRVSVASDPQIYVNFHDLTAREALDYLEATLALNGISVLPVGEKFFQIIETTEAGRVGDPIQNKSMDEYRRLGSFTQRVVQLKYVPTDVAKQVLEPLASAGNEATAIMEIPTNNLLILKDYEPNVKRMLEMIEKVDVNVPLEVKSELIPIRYALADEIAQVLGTLTPSGAVSSGGGTSRNSRFGSGRSRTGSTGLNNQQQQQQQQPNTPGASQNRNAFQNRLANIVNRAAAGDFQILGDTRIIPDERTNSILVFANERDMQLIKDIITKLDVVQAQVLIEAVVMEVSIGENEDLGVSIVNRNPKGTGGSITDPGLSDTFLNPGQFSGNSTGIPGLPSGFSYFSQLGSDINVAVRALSSDRKATVLQRPRIQTFHAREASIVVGERRPFVGSTFFGNAAIGTSSQINYQEISVELHVLPLINQEGLVVLEIEQIVKDLNGFETIDGNRVPVVAERRAQASVAVQDGQTIILGGMITTNKNISHSGVPVLKDIPIMGNLFKSKSETENQVELIVLIRPKVMPTPEIARDVATNEIDKLIATQQAQIEIQESRDRLASRFQKEKSKSGKRQNSILNEDYVPPASRNKQRQPFENYPTYPINE